MRLNRKENHIPSEGFLNLEDERLVLQVRSQDHEALQMLLERYIPVAAAKAKGNRIDGMDWDDIFQEAMIGLVGAIRSYQEGRESSFKTFANLCMNRRIASAVQAQKSLKHKPFQNYVSFSEGECVQAQLAARSPHELDPEHIIIQRETMQERKQQIMGLLSVFEREALMLYIVGFTYEEISQRLESTPKAIDNALQRVRRKLRSAS